MTHIGTENSMYYYVLGVDDVNRKPSFNQLILLRHLESGNV